MRKLLATLTLAFTLAGCGTIAGIDATTVLGPTLFKDAVKTDDRVTVADFRTKDVQEAVVENTKSGTIVTQSEFKDGNHNWNKISTASTVVVTDRPTVAQQTQQTKEQIQHDKSMTLTWFFFSMMLMGMLGAGIIGLIEAVSGRNSLDTTPSAPPPRFKPHNNNNQQNKKGK